MARRVIRRFWKDVTLEPRDGGLVVSLDGRPARTPLGRALMTSMPALAEALRAEWASQPEELDPRALTLSRLHGFVLDGGEGLAQESRQIVLTYAGTDLLCYRAPDPELARRQEALWDPILVRLTQSLGSGLRLTTGLAAIAQPPATLAAIAARLDRLTDERAYAVRLLAEITGSAVLAMAIDDGALGPEQALEAARLDEHFQAERWGLDAEAAARLDAIRGELQIVCRYAELIGAAAASGAM